MALSGLKIDEKKKKANKFTRTEAAIKRCFAEYVFF